jgi:hypothetical protein
MFASDCVEFQQLAHLPLSRAFSAHLALLPFLGLRPGIHELQLRPVFRP